MFLRFIFSVDPSGRAAQSQTQSRGQKAAQQTHALLLLVSSRDRLTVKGEKSTEYGQTYCLR